MVWIVNLLGDKRFPYIRSKDIIKLYKYNGKKVHQTQLNQFTGDYKL